MSYRPLHRQCAVGAAILATLVATAACGGGGSNGGTTGPTPAIALSLDIPSASILAGGSTVTSATVTSSGGFTGAVTISVDAPPAGITGSVGAATTAGGTTTSALTITVGAAVSAGAYNIVIRAAGAGVAAVTRTFALTVTAPPPPAYTLAVTGSPVNVNQGGSGQATISITRTGGFSGSVALTVEGAPAGLTTTLTPTATTGGSSTLVVNASAVLAATTYTLTIRGVASGLADRTTTVQVVVAAVSGSGDVTLTATTCGLDPIVWVAYQDGAGAWTRVLGVNDVYHFSITSARGGFVYVKRHSNSVPEITMQLMTRAQLSAAPFDLCPLGPIKQVNGTVASLGASQLVNIALGGGFALATSVVPTFTISGVMDGVHDLVAYRYGGFPSATDRMIIHRDLNPPFNSSVGTLDFAAAEAFAPLTATITVNGYGASEGAQSNMSYLTGATCDIATLYTQYPQSNAQAAFGVPAAPQRATDFHMWTAIAATANSSRTVSESFHTFGPRTMTMPTAITPTVTITGTNYKQHQLTLTLPAEYNANVLLNVVQTNGVPHPVHINATPQWIGGSAVAIGLPDFTGVSGWQNTWAPAVGSTTRWDVIVSGTNGAASLCTEGARTVQAIVSGNP